MLASCQLEKLKYLEIKIITLAYLCLVSLDLHYIVFNHNKQMGLYLLSHFELVLKVIIVY